MGPEYRISFFSSAFETYSKRFLQALMSYKLTETEVRDGVQKSQSGLVFYHPERVYFVTVSVEVYIIFFK